MRTSVKNCAKSALAFAHALRGANTARALVARHPFLILCYHRVVPEDRLDAALFPGLCVTADAFDRQLAFLRGHYEVATLADAFTRRTAAAEGRAAETGRADERPLAVVTFDDGYRDNHDVALQILEAHGVPATVFVVADYIGTGRALWFDVVARRVVDADARGLTGDVVRAWRETAAFGPAAAAVESAHVPRAARIRAVANALKAIPDDQRTAAIARATEIVGANPAREAEERLMTWDEVGAMARAGVEIGSHTATHPILPGLDAARLAAETAGARDTIARRLGAPPTSFCYPNGDHDDAVVRAVADAGYACAVTTHDAPNPRDTDAYRLNRAFIGPRTGFGLGDRVRDRVLCAELAGVL